MNHLTPGPLRGRGEKNLGIDREVFPFFTGDGAFWTRKGPLGKKSLGGSPPGMLVVDLNGTAPKHKHS